MARKSQGKTGTQRTSQRRRAVAAAKAAEEKNNPEPEPGNLPTMPPSPLAEWLLSTDAKARARAWERLQIAASLGRLTKADLQAAFVTQMRIEVDAFERDPEGFEAERKAHVNRQRLLRSLADIVKQTTSSGPLMVVRMVWPAHYLATDPGEDVRLEVPEDRSVQ